MQAKNIWNEIEYLKGQTLRTLARQKPFIIVAVSDKSITVMPLSTNKERPIQRAGIENAFQRLTSAGELTLADLEADFTPLNPVYTAAILAKMRGVKVYLKPTRLKWEG
jgi:hypothetical protein